MAGQKPIIAKNEESGEVFRFNQNKRRWEPIFAKNEETGETFQFTTKGWKQFLPPQEKPTVTKDLVWPIAKDVGGTIAHAGAGLVKGMTLGAVDPEAGTIGVPFTDKRKQITPPLSQGLEMLGVSKEIANNPYISLAGEAAGIVAPWSRASDVVGQVSAKVAPKAATSTFGKAARTGAEEAVAGGIVGAAMVREDDESMLEQAMTFAAIGGGVGMAVEMAIPIVQYLKTKPWAKPRADQFSTEDLANAFTGAGEASEGAKNFVASLSREERKKIAKDIIQQRKAKNRSFISEIKANRKTETKQQDKVFRLEEVKDAKNVREDAGQVPAVRDVTESGKGKSGTDLQRPQEAEPKAGDAKDTPKEATIELRSVKENEGALKKFDQLASKQRGAPEETMLDIQHGIGGGVYSFVAEHAGDIINRMAKAMHVTHDMGREYVADKTAKVLRTLTREYGFEREFKENLKSNYEYFKSTGNWPLGREGIKEAFGGTPPNSLAEFEAGIKALAKRYAREHDALPVYNKAQWLAREAAKDIGTYNFEGAIEKLEKLQVLADDKKAWEKDAETFLTDSKGEILEYDSPKAARAIQEGSVKAPAEAGTFEVQAGVTVKPTGTPASDSELVVPESPPFRLSAPLESVPAEAYTNPETVMAAIRHGRYTIVTGNNPGTEEVPPEKNAELTAAFKKELDDKGIEYIGPLPSKYENIPEDSFLLVNVNPEEALALGKKFGQSAIASPKGLYFTDGAFQPAAGYAEHLPTAEDNFTTLTLDNGKELKFSIPINWEAKEPEIDEIMEMYGGGPAVGDVRDWLGMAEKNLEINLPDVASQPGVLAAVASPNRIARKFPMFRKVFQIGVKVPEETDRIRSVFHARLDKINSILKKSADRELYNTIRVIGDMEGKRFSPKELRERFGAPDNVIRAYSLVRSTYDKMWALMNAERVRAGKEPVGYREGYVHHMFHKWFIIGKDGILHSVPTLHEAIKLGNKMTRAGVKVRIAARTFKFEGEESQAAVIGDIAYFKAKRRVEKDFEFSPEEAAEILSSIVRMKGRNRYMGIFMQRKGATGWEKDLFYVDRHYVNMMSRYLATNPFKRKAVSLFERNFGPYDAQHRGIALYTKNYINDILGVPTLTEELLNASLENTPLLSQWLGKHIGDRPSIQLAGNVTTAVAVAKLGLYNASAALVNATQFLMINAKLGTKYTLLGMNGARKVSTQRIRKYFGLSHKPVPEERILKRLGVDLQQGLESGGGGYSKFNVSKLAKKTLFMFSAMEFELRATAAIGAYRKAIDSGLSPRAAEEYARTMNYEANFNYSMADAPDLIRRSGPLGSVLLQFKKFPIKATEFILDLRGWEHPRFWIPLFLLAGYFGFPGMDAMNNMVRGLFGINMEMEMKNYLINWAQDDPERMAVAKTIFYGLFANDMLGGVDVSHRVGAGDFIPSDAGDLFGPFFSSTVRAAQLASEEKWADALKAIATSPGNIVEALTIDEEITSPWKRDRTVARIDKKGRIIRALGMIPVDVSLERDKARIIRYLESKRGREEQRAIDAFIKDPSNENREKLAELGIEPRRVASENVKKTMTESERAFSALPARKRGKYVDVFMFYRKSKPKEKKE